jgi:hypothetical protein
MREERSKDRGKMWIIKGAFRRPVKGKCHEPDMDDKGRLVFDVMERQRDSTTKFT